MHRLMNHIWIERTSLRLNNPVTKFVKFHWLRMRGLTATSSWDFIGVSPSLTFSCLPQICCLVFSHKHILHTLHHFPEACLNPQWSWNYIYSQALGCVLQAPALHEQGLRWNIKTRFAFAFRGLQLEWLPTASHTRTKEMSLFWGQIRLNEDLTTTRSFVLCSWDSESSPPRASVLGSSARDKLAVFWTRAETKLGQFDKFKKRKCLLLPFHTGDGFFCRQIDVRAELASDAHWDRWAALYAREWHAKSRPTLTRTWINSSFNLWPVSQCHIWAKVVKYCSNRNCIFPCSACRLARCHCAQVPCRCIKWMLLIELHANVRSRSKFGRFARYRIVFWKRKKICWDDIFMPTRTSD